MSLQNELIKYLTSIRDDAKDPARIDKLKKHVKSFKGIQLDETQLHSQKTARLINLLFAQMPEIKEADPSLQKVDPLCDYCETLPAKTKKANKRPRL